jgi:hypothetical protein
MTTDGFFHEIRQERYVVLTHGGKRTDVAEYILARISGCQQATKRAANTRTCIHIKSLMNFLFILSLPF